MRSNDWLLSLHVCFSQFTIEQALKQQRKVATDHPLLIKETMAPSYDTMPKSQRFFIMTFVKPLLDTLADVIPSFHQEASANLEKNLEHWEALANNTVVQG